MAASVNTTKQDRRSGIEKQWEAAQLFVAKGPSTELEYLGDEIRSRLSAYRTQALEGPCPSDSTVRMKEEAWRALGDMPEEEAKRLFVTLLTTVIPGWKEWDEIHGAALRSAQVEGGEAERLLKAFRMRTSLQLRSRL